MDININTTSNEPLLILASGLDLSVNFVRPNGQESRFVRRVEDYFIAYLSSHNGCNKACRFCHLTQTKQTQMEPSTFEDLVAQLKPVLYHYRQQVDSGKQAKAKKLNINFMARGEPLENLLLRSHVWPTTQASLARVILSSCSELDLKFNISTIMPQGLTLKDLPQTALDTEYPTVLYYSLYSVNPEFRRKWLPKAMDPKEALDLLANWSTKTNSKVVLHWAFIQGQNDSEQDVADVLAAVKTSGLRAKFNCVRYNPYSENQGQESDLETVESRFNKIKSDMAVEGSRIVPRVGPDVYASCGMFLGVH